MSAFDVPPLDGESVGIAEWRREVAEHFVPLDIHPLTDAPFEGRLARTDVGDVSIVRIEHAPAIVARTPKLVRAGSGDLVKVSLQLSGDEVVEQDGRVALLHPGDVAVYDTSRPYTLRFDEPTQHIVIAFPHGYLDLPREELAAVTAIAFPSESPLGRVVNPFLAGLASSLEELPSANGGRLARTALDLLMTLISAELQHGVQRDPKRQLLHELLSTIDRLLADPGLSPTHIAQAHFISTRHLHAVFAERGITVAGWIRERRLEHIRRDLADATLRETPVAAIAAKWGLVNPAHFSRLFRATFEQSPTEYRAGAMPPGESGDEVLVEMGDARATATDVR